jgi:hypothetical protein
MRKVLIFAIEDVGGGTRSIRRKDFSIEPMGPHLDTVTKLNLGFWPNILFDLGSSGGYA